MRTLVFVVLLLASCGTTAPAGYTAYCERHPDRQECGGTK